MLALQSLELGMNLFYKLFHITRNEVHECKQVEMSRRDCSNTQGSEVNLAAFIYRTVL